MFCLQCLFVAQTDNIETSACIISPPKVKYDFFFSFFVFNILELLSIYSENISFNFCSFLLNGSPVDRRTNVLMVCAIPFTLWITLCMTAFGADCSIGLIWYLCLCFVSFIRKLDHSFQQMWLQFLNMEQIFFKL